MAIDDDFEMLDDSFDEASLPIGRPRPIARTR